LTHFKLYTVQRQLGALRSNRIRVRPSNDDRNLGRKEGLKRRYIAKSNF